MENLLNSEDQAKLNELLEKQNKAKEEQKKYEQVLDSVKSRIESHKNSVSKILKQRQLEEEVFNALNEIDSTLFVLEEHVSRITTNYFDSWHKFSDEHKDYARKHFGIEGDEIKAEISDWKVSIPALGYTVRIEKFAKSRYEGEKIWMQLSNTYSNRYASTYKTIVNNVKKEIEVQKKKAAKKDYRLNLIAEAEEVFMEKFVDAKVKHDRKWKSSHYSRRGGEGYYVDEMICTYDDGLEMTYSFGRNDEGEITYNLTNVNFNLLSAMKAGYNDIEIIEKLQELRSNLKK